jgi:plastocyanin
MRTFLLALLVLLTMPLVGALPVVCGTDCHIDASSTGYTPPVAILASGSSITWDAIDIGHVTRDGPLAGADTCFMVVSPSGGDAPPARFDIMGGTLFATVEGETTACTAAVGNEAAGFTLNYFCAIHPTMRGAIIVTAYVFAPRPQQLHG